MQTVGQTSHYFISGVICVMHSPPANEATDKRVFVHHEITNLYFVSL